MAETRKQYEERLLTELLQETHQPLSNILLFAAAWLEGNHNSQPRETDMALSKTLHAYIRELDKRLREVRE